MTVLASTDFTGANGAAWPAPWTTLNGTSTIQTNRGQQVTPATQWTDAVNRANLDVAAVRVTATARFPALAGRSLRINVRYNPATGNGYRIIIPGDYTGFQLLRVDAYTETELAADWTVTWAADTDYRVVFEADGSTVRAKRWVVGAGEPGTWHVTTTDATYSTGDVVLQTVTSTAASATGLWDDVTVEDTAAAYPPPPVVGTRSSARVGFHNDAVGAPSDDYGTYTTFTSMSTTDTRAYMAAQTGSVPMLGESAVANAPATDYANLAGEFATYSWTGLNPQYHPDVLNAWSQADKDDAAVKFGHRLRLTAATVTPTAAAGGDITLNLTVANDGWSAPLRQRPVRVVFTQGGSTVSRAVTGVDIRTWGPGSRAVNWTVPAPDGGGVWDVHLHFPDPSPSIEANPAYAIQLAHVGLWQASTGLNSLDRQVTVTAVDTLTPADTGHGHTGDATALTQTHALAPVDAAHAHTADTTTAAQVHALAPADTGHGHATDAGAALAQIHVTAPSDAAHAHTTDAGALTQLHALAAPADTAHGHAVDVPALTQTHATAPADTLHAHTADASATAQSHELAPTDTAHGHTATVGAALAQTHALTPADTAHAHQADVAGLSAEGDLVTAATVHGHTADTSSLTQTHALAPTDTAHGHAATAAGITQTGTLTPADIAHAHTADAAGLTQAHALAGADTAHGHTADTSTVTAQGDLTPADTVHGHTAEASSLTQAHELAPADTGHAHTATAAAAIIGTYLVPNHATHGHAADTSGLTQAHQLAPADATHQHTADGGTLAQTHALAPADTIHGHIADPTIAYMPSGLPPPASRTHTIPQPARIHTAAGTGPRTFNV